MQSTSIEDLIRRIVRDELRRLVKPEALTDDARDDDDAELRALVRERVARMRRSKPR